MAHGRKEGRHCRTHIPRFARHRRHAACDRRQLTSQLVNDSNCKKTEKRVKSDGCWTRSKSLTTVHESALWQAQSGHTEIRCYLSAFGLKQTSVQRVTLFPIYEYTP